MSKNLSTTGWVKMHSNGYILLLCDYCCTIWSETTSNNIDKRCQLQKKKYARLILDSTFDTPKQLFKILG